MIRPENVIMDTPKDFGIMKKHIGMKKVSKKHTKKSLNKTKKDFTIPQKYDIIYV